MIIATEYSQTWLFRSTRQTAADSSVFVYANFASIFLANHSYLLLSYFLPVLPTLRLITSSTYLIRFTFIWFRCSLLADFSRILTNFFFVNSLYNNKVLSVNSCFNSFRIFHLNRMRVSRESVKFLPCFSSTVTNTVYFQSLLIAFCNTDNHVINQCSG